MSSTSVIGQPFLRHFLEEDELNSAQIGLCVLDVSTGERLMSHNAEKFFTPASTMKLLTSYAALKVLGPQYKFQTQVAYSGEIDSGVLKGDLIVIGGGDPTLGSDEFLNNPNLHQVLKTIVKAIVNKGISSIQGDVVLYTGRYSGYGEQGSWPFKDLANYYGTGAYGVNIHENSFALLFNRSNQVGELTTIKEVQPEVDSLRWENFVFTGSRGSRDEAYIYGAPFSRERVIRGTIPPGNSPFTIKGSLPAPAYHLGKWLLGALNGSAIHISGTVKVIPEEGGRQFNSLIVLYSPPLIDIIKEMNERSVNLYAEALVKEIAYIRTGKGDVKEGLKVLKQELSFSNKEVHQQDGSGLSPFNAISPAVYCSFLRHAANDEDYRNEFLYGMAIYGRTGTLRYMLKNTLLEGKARGKSGSITGVRAYTGIMQTAHGREIAFSIFIDKFYGNWSKVRPHVELLMLEIAKTF